MAMFRSTFLKIIEEKYKNYFIGLENNSETLNILVDCDNEFISLDSQYQVEKTNSEQSEFYTKKELDECIHKLKESNERISVLEEEKCLSHKNFQSQKETLDLLKKENVELLCSHRKKCDECENLEKEKRHAVELSVDKSSRIKSLEGEYNELSERLNKTIDQKNDVVYNLENARSQKIDLEFKIKQLEREIEFNQIKIGSIEKENESMANRLHEYSYQYEDKFLLLKRENEDKSVEIKRLNLLKESLQSACASHQQNIDSLLLKQKEMEDEFNQRESSIQGQLISQEKMSSLYKDSFNEVKACNSELVTKLKECESVIKETQISCLSLQNDMSDLTANFKLGLQEKENIIVELKGEISEANFKLHEYKVKGICIANEENLALLSPSAAAVSKLLKSGMTLTQLYTAHSELLEAFNEVELSNKKLKNEMHLILKELDLKAPVLMEQSSQYKKSQVTINLLSKQLEDSQIELDKLKLKNSLDLDTLNTFSQEISRLKRSISDKNEQIKNLLLYTDVKSSDMNIFALDEYQEPDSSGIQSSSDIITQKLIKFRNVEELLKKNEELGTAFRELVAQREKEEAETEKSHEEEINTTKGELNSQIQTMNSHIAEQNEKLENLKKQRDVYRVLLTQGNTNTLSFISHDMEIEENSSSKTVVNSSKELSECKKTIEELQEELYKSAKKNGEKQECLYAEIDSLKKEAMDLRLKNAKTASEMTYVSEKSDTLLKNTESYKLELEQLKESNAKIKSDLSKALKDVATLSSDLLKVKQEKCQIDNKYDEVKLQISLLKEREEHLIKENESFGENNRQNALIMANICSMQNQLKQANFITTCNLEAKIEELSEQNNDLNLKLDSCKNSQSQDLREAEEALEKYKLANNELITKCHEREEQIKKLTEKYEHILKEFELLKSTGVFHDSNGTENEQFPLNRDETVANISNRVEDLEQKNEYLKKDVQQYKEMADSIESRCVQQVKDFELQEAAFLEKSRQLNDDIERLSEELVSSTLKKGELLKELAEYEVKYNDLKEELNKQIQEAMLMSEQNTLKLEEAERSALSNKEAMLNYKKEIDDLKDKYENEVKAHASDQKDLENIRASLATYQEKNEEISLKLEEQTLLAQKHDSVIKLCEENHKGEIEILQTRYAELEKRNVVLHDELGVVGNNFATLSHAMESPLNVLSKDPSVLKNSEQLLEVLEYLRNDKKIALSKCSVHEKEAAKFKLKTEALQKENDNLNKLVSRLKDENFSKLLHYKNAEDVYGKIESINAMSDCNVELREKVESLEDEVKSQQSKLIESENAIKHYKEQLSTNGDSYKTKEESLMGEIEYLKQEISNLTKEAKSLKETCDDFEKEYSKVSKNLADFDTYHNSKIEEVNKKILLENAKCSKTMIELEERESRCTMINKMLSDKQEENSHLKAEISRLQAQTVRNEEQAKKDLKDKSLLQAELESKVEEIDSKLTQISQLKLIARKYRNQYEECINKNTHEVFVQTDVQDYVDDNSADSSSSLSNLMTTNKKLLEDLEIQKVKILDLTQQIEDFDLRFLSLKSQYESKRHKTELENSQQEGSDIRKIQESNSSVCQDSSSYNFVTFPLFEELVSVETPTANIKPFISGNIASTSGKPAISIRPMTIYTAVPERCERSSFVCYSSATLSTSLLAAESMDEGPLSSSSSSSSTSNAHFQAPCNSSSISSTHQAKVSPFSSALVQQENQILDPNSPHTSSTISSILNLTSSFFPATSNNFPTQSSDFSPPNCESNVDDGSNSSSDVIQIEQCESAEMEEEVSTVSSSNNMLSSSHARNEEPTVISKRSNSPDVTILSPNVCGSKKIRVHNVRSDNDRFDECLEEGEITSYVQVHSHLRPQEASNSESDSFVKSASPKSCVIVPTGVDQASSDAIPKNEAENFGCSMPSTSTLFNITESQSDKTFLENPDAFPLFPHTSEWASSSSGIGDAFAVCPITAPSQDASRIFQAPTRSTSCEPASTFSFISAAFSSQKDSYISDFSSKASASSPLPSFPFHAAPPSDAEQRAEVSKLYDSDDEGFLSSVSGSTLSVSASSAISTSVADLTERPSKSSATSVKIKPIVFDLDVSTSTVSQSTLTNPSPSFTQRHRSSGTVKKAYTLDRRNKNPK